MQMGHSWFSVLARGGKDSSTSSGTMCFSACA